MMMQDRSEPPEAFLPSPLQIVDATDPTATASESTNVSLTRRSHRLLSPQSICQCLEWLPARLSTALGAQASSRSSSLKMLAANRRPSSVWRETTSSRPVGSCSHYLIPMNMSIMP